MENYKKFLKNSVNLQQIRDERVKEISRDDLYQQSKKNIKTTMIGSLDAFEKSFGFLWNLDGTHEPTEEHKFFLDLWNQVRDKILDNGNSQIRNMGDEFANYEIKRKKYQINLPVVGKDNQQLGDKNDGKS